MSAPECRASSDGDVRLDRLRLLVLPQGSSAAIDVECWLQVVADALGSTA